LENRAEELDKKDKRLKQLEAEINTRTQELDLKEERLLTETNNWEDQQKRYRQLAEWYENGETAKIALALSSDRISIEEIVSGLRFVEPGIASEIVGALANLNPDKAAQILAYLAGKEVIR
jgi:flagellar motility protein MotE (MotC chaperone)